MNFINAKKEENSPNIALITIYRNDKDNLRQMQKNQFLHKIKMLNKFGKFDIFLIQQSNDGYKFNLGKLKNIGYDLTKKLKKKYDFFVFSDIDVVPDGNLAEYYFHIKDGICCLGVRGTRYNSNNCFTGTCIAFNKKSFEEINGYPNNFWGWGGEDDCIRMRCNINKIQFYTPKKGNIIDLELNNKGNKISNDEKFKYLKKNNLKEMLKREKIILDRKIWKNNGINNLEYTILSSKIEKKNEYNLFYFLVDLNYKFDIKNFSYWFDLSKYKKLSDEENILIYKKVRKKYFWCKFKCY